MSGGLAGPTAAEERDGTAIHLQQALVAKLCANAVEVFQVHAHQIRQVVVAEGGMHDKGIDDEDVSRVDVGGVEESARDRAHELLCQIHIDLRDDGHDELFGGEGECAPIVGEPKGG